MFYFGIFWKKEESKYIHIYEHIRREFLFLVYFDTVIQNIEMKRNVMLCATRSNRLSAPKTLSFPQNVLF